MPSSAYPATAEISTLSLHDALPISMAGALKGELHDPSMARAELMIHRARAIGRDSARVPIWNVQGGTTVLVDVVRIGSDSVVVNLEIGRAHVLNSSHGYISYAVFCLSGDRRDLHSFPTRRSSDLDGWRAQRRAP